MADLPKKYCTKCGSVLRREGDYGYCDRCMLKFHIPEAVTPVEKHSGLNIFSNLFKPHKYDMDSLSGINAIPVPAKDYNSGDWTKDCIYYVLQRKATEHKKNKRLDLAIACLRKSNALSDYESKPLLAEKDYLRLVKYLRLNGENEAADYEEQQIYARHPEFRDKRFSNRDRILSTIRECKEYKVDLVYVTTNSHCSICKAYNNKIFSISGRSKKYPKLPEGIIRDGGMCPNCIVGITMKFNI